MKSDGKSLFTLSSNFTAKYDEKRRKAFFIRWKKIMISFPPSLYLVKKKKNWKSWTLVSMNWQNDSNNDGLLSFYLIINCCYFWFLNEHWIHWCRIGSWICLLVWGLCLCVKMWFCVRADSQITQEEKRRNRYVLKTKQNYQKRKKVRNLESVSRCIFSFIFYHFMLIKKGNLKCALFSNTESEELAKVYH